MQQSPFITIDPDHRLFCSPTNIAVGASAGLCTIGFDGVQAASSWRPGRAGQRVGLSLEELHAALAALPEGRTPTQSDWERLVRDWQRMLDERLALLMRLREQLGNCIGCGCLSLKRCALYNPQDQAAVGGSGVRYWLGQKPPV